MKLIPDWREAWRWFSMQAYGLQAGAIAAWGLVPDDLRSAVPSQYLAGGAFALVVLGMIGRVVDQGK